ncbi:LysM peptidoglycan-binding domain-containing protein [uncultured Ruegeria sp.]|uniref:LysM peptidoglycan-binding domain-containing protein n=1 Tax=uncultured Ruegeria sp. TaxID=259304 RepID=UPI0026238FAF|nr:LysM peptidoglycan-binding domain-containing protein [uncultured Ruegeria sp.]
MNAKSGSGGSGTFIWGLVAGIVVVIGAAGLYLLGVFGGPEEQTAPDVAEATEPAAETVAQDAVVEDQPEPQTSEAPEVAAEDAPAEITEEAPASDETKTATVVAPVLDQIFVEPDGNAVLSGSGEPGSEISVLLDGEAVHRFTVDDSGQFAEFVSIPFADDSRGLVLEAATGEKAARSDDYLIAALPAPVAAEDVTEEPSVPVDEAETEVADAETAPVVAAETPAPAGTETQSAETITTDVQVAEQADPTSEPEAPQTEGSDATDQQIAILRSGEEGVELVQTPTARETPPDQIALDTIGYSDSGDVELTGRVQDGSAVRLYLDNQLVADLEPDEDGQWRGEVEGIDPGVYTLRVDEVSSDGTVVSRLETPFKREPVETLLAAEGAETEDASAETPAIRSVTVQKGDTLWAISRDRFGDGVLYVKLFEANKDSIRDPDLIYPGQIFTIPE